MKAINSKNSSESTHTATPFLSGDNKKGSFFPSSSQKNHSFFGPTAIQPKLEIGQPDDKYEQEADRVADTVMRMPDAQIQRQPVEEEEEELQMKREDTLIQRKCEECEEEEKLQKKTDKASSANHSSSNISSQLASQTGSGSSLPKPVRSEMAHKMGADFSGVNIHTGPAAHKLSNQLGARAFTHGSDIYFNKGEYNPASRSGQHLLAHELTHVVQQGVTTEDRGIAPINRCLISKTSPDFIQRQEIIDFSDEEGSHIEVPVEEIAGRGREAGEREVEAEIEKLRGWVNLYLSAYRDGLNSFSDTMSFSSDEEARPRYFDVALKEVGKVLLDELINYATTGMPIIGPVVKGAKSVMTGLYDEAQRAQTAQGEARIRSYIVSTRNAISEESGIHRQLLEIMDAARPILLNEYRGAVYRSSIGAPDEGARQEMAESQGVEGVITGEAATFIRELRTQVEQFKNRVPSAAVFQRRFTERFADTPGLTDYVSQGGEESGSLHLEMNVYREREGSGEDAFWSYQISDTSSAWELATSAPNASRLAQSLMDSTGGNVRNTLLPKYLHVRVETETFGLNDYGRAVIYFRDPSDPDFRGWDISLSRWVWDLPQVKQRALSVNRITER